ncbi:MAG TPA: 3-oxoadipate enol-lactonase [Beijerinckiaceae bacterium]|nr:3-oxoadipate enol-lactonase [Beijerinckiaceae bacterium]
MPMLTIGNEAFHYQLEGPKGAPVLMLSNSLGTDLTMWNTQAAAWSQSFRVLRYDSRGHGRSTAPARPYSIAELGRDALAIMDALKLDRVHWCGLSKGGMVGQWLLTNARDRIGKSVLANTASRMGPPELWNTRIRTVTASGLGAIADTTRERWFSPKARASANPEIDRIIETFRSVPVAGYCGCCAAIRDMDQHWSIRSIANPVLVIIGKHDPATPPAAGEHIARSIRGAKKKLLDAAHLSNIEQPAAFTRAVAEFLA